jgi:thiamine biosynthesis protein ThiI
MKSGLNELLWLVKPGELTLKGLNRPVFEKKLKANLAAMLKGTRACIDSSHNRLYVRLPLDALPEGFDVDAARSRIEEALSRLAGISGYAPAEIAPKEPGTVLVLCVKIAGENLDRGSTFKVDFRRTDKSFPLSSHELNCQAGDRILTAYPGLKVDVHKPAWTIRGEIRERAFVYGREKRGCRGLPAGTAGKGLLLLSGGIDSPVAGHLMMLRGMRLDAVYFHAYPYTSEEARQKVVSLAEILGKTGMGVRLYSVSLTKIETAIKAQCPAPWATVLGRMAMMEIAARMAKKLGDKCLVTGESLSQVASQTAENIACTESAARRVYPTLPVLRPLIGMDKEDIIRIAERIGTYETSILPYPDACAVFSPDHPVLRGDPAEAMQLYESLNAEVLIDEAIKSAVVTRCGFPT